MTAKAVSLADLLTAAGAAMATANSRLAAAGAPAMLRDASLTLEFNGQIQLQGDTLLLSRLAQPSLQALALAGRAKRASNTSLTVNLMAAPAVKPVAPA